MPVKNRVPCQFSFRVVGGVREAHKGCLETKLFERCEVASPHGYLLNSFRFAATSIKLARPARVQGETAKSRLTGGRMSDPDWPPDPRGHPSQGLNPIRATIHAKQRAPSPLPLATVPPNGPLKRHSRSCRLSARKPADSVSQTRLEIKVSRPLRIPGIRETPHAVLRLRVLPQSTHSERSIGILIGCSSLVPRSARPGGQSPASPVNPLEAGARSRRVRSSG